MGGVEVETLCEVVLALAAYINYSERRCGEGPTRRDASIAFMIR